MSTDAPLKQDKTEDPGPTPLQVAEWMIAKIQEDEELPQQVAAHEILDRFGPEFVYTDPDGYLAISRKVLYRFRKLSGERVVWVAVQGNWIEGFWRLRVAADLEGRTQYFY